MTTLTDRRLERTNAGYDARVAQWVRCRHAIEGEDAVKAAGTTYLPKLSSHDHPVHGQARYDAYKARAMFYGAAGRTVEALAGALVRKVPALAWPDDDQLLETVGADGSSFDSVRDEVLGETIGVGRVVLLVDAAAEEDDASPYVTMYQAEALHDWEVTRIGDRLAVTMLKLAEENVEENEKGELKTYERRRILRLGVPPTLTDADPGMGMAQELVEGPVYFQELWEKRERWPDNVQGDKWRLIEVIVPRMSGGRVLREIPARVINATHLGPKARKPIILDMVNVNMSHYRSSADLEHGRHWTALPTPWAAGFDVPESGTLDVGSEAAWLANEPTAKAGYLEFAGSGLGHLADALAEKKKEMAALSARLLDEPPKGVEAAETVKMRHAGEESALTRAANNVGQGLSEILQLLRFWQVPTAGGEREELADEVGITFSTDFNRARMDPTELQALMAAVQGGMLSWQSMFWNLERGEMIPEGVTEEDEATRILAGPPASDAGPLAGGELLVTGPGGRDQHTHQFDPTAGETEAAPNGHKHKITRGADGRITIEDWGNTENQHGHSVPEEAQVEVMA